MHIHILGICGTFMGGVAALAREAGHTVSGCDSGVYPPMSDQLRGLGIEVIEGYGSDQLAFKPDVWVIGNVVSRARLANGQPKYPLMEAILDAGLPYTSGPQWLADHVLHSTSARHHVVAVAGTHGKTTTTSMLAWILECAGLQPGFLVGGVPQNFAVSARLGSRTTTAQGAKTLLRPFVIEADEYDTAFFDKRSKFVHYRPRTAILNNLEFDHADIFDNIEAIERQFHHLVRTVPSSGTVVWNANEASLSKVVAMGCWSEAQTFGTQAQWQADGDATDFAVVWQGQAQGRVLWQLSGAHNQMNALAAIAAAQRLGVAPQQACAALASFTNVRRRMELRGTVALPGGNVTVYDDFAHHPTAIRTTVDGLRHKLKLPAIGTGPTGSTGSKGRILAAFEPRSNTMKLGAMKAQLPWSLEQADLVFCHAGGLDWDATEALAPMGSRAKVLSDVDGMVAAIATSAQAGDHILCMSNGSFGGIHQKLLTALAQRATVTL